MKFTLNFKNGTPKPCLPYFNYIKSTVLGILFLTIIQENLHAQLVKYEKPSWWFGVSGGANLNYYRGSTQQLNAAFTPPVAFHDGNGTGLFVTPLLEYHNSYSGLGFMLQAGYDNRSSSFDQVISDCNCPADLSTKLTYITVEPSFRFSPGNSNFYLFGGPRIAFNMDKSFIYELGLNPDIPNQLPTPAVTGDIDNVRKTLISMQIGAGFDIPLNSQANQLQAVLSPFVSFQPYYGQSPRTVETWNITTVRLGAGMKFGKSSKVVENSDVLPMNDGISFSVYSPKNIPVERRMRETFPLRNYIFFDLGSTEIPERYVLINKNQVQDFKENQLEVFAPKNLTGRSDREMTVYYNILNIIGDRMQKNPKSVITLVGSSEQGPEDGTKMALSVKKYLTNTFGIDATRIQTEGRNKPEIPSLQPGAKLEVDLLKEGDRRVTVESNSPDLLMEFQSGTSMSLKPVEIVAVQKAPLDSYVTFNVEDNNNIFSSWSLNIKDSKGASRYFGPFTTESVSIPGKSILGTQPEDDFVVTMEGIKKTGGVIKKESNVHMVLWTPSKDEEGMRYSVLFEFNDSKTIGIYNKYLSDVVTPKIPVGATVFIHGYTDKIGNETFNQKLSLARANEIKTIIEKSLSKSGRSDAKFVVYGFGEEPNLSPFNNDLPEERFYNRTVIIDIIPRNP